jgi:hypothetical protein
MKPFKTVLLASAFLAGGMLAAAAQSTGTPSAGATGGISAATHCKDAQGNARLKTAASGSSSSMPSNSGSATGSSSSGSGMTGDATSGTSDSAAVAANLPPCPN